MTTTTWSIIITPTKEELEAHEAENMKWREQSIHEIQQRPNMSEEDKKFEIEPITSGTLDTRLLYTNLLCDKCGQFVVKAYDDHLNHTVTKCEKCNRSYDFLEKEYRVFERMFVKETIRKHNLEETSWGKIVETEITALQTARDTLDKEIKRLTDMLEEGEEEKNY